MNARDILAAARVRAVTVHPYFSAALFRLNFVESSRCDTMAVDTGLRCYYNPKRVVEWGVEVVAGVLVHEVGHVLREHARRRCEREPETWNTACDAEINDDLNALPLPEGVIQPEKLKHPVTGAPLVRGLSAEEYHAILSLTPPEPESSSSSDESDDDEGDEDEAPGDNEDGSEGEDERDDSGSAESNAGESDDDAEGESESASESSSGASTADADGDESQDESASGTKEPPNGSKDTGEDESDGEPAGDTLDSGGEDGPSGAEDAESGSRDSSGGSPSSDEQPGDDAERVPGAGGCGGCAGNPAPWEDEVDPDDPELPEPVSDAEQEMMRRNVADQIIEYARNRGTMPGSWREWAASKLAPPTIDWRKRLAGLVRRAIADASGASDYTLRKPSRRAAGLRAVLGDRAPAIPALVQPVPKVGIVLDTSGSMGGPTFDTALAECIGVVKAIGFPVETIACDAQVQARASVANERELAKLGFSGGGTDLRVGILAAERSKCEVVVVITDGETPWPRRETTRCRLVAAIIGNEQKEAPAWIPVVRPPATK